MRQIRAPGESASEGRTVPGRLYSVTSMPAVQDDAVPTRKARGAFFTPKPLCKYVADWAVRTAGDRILEPSCGEAAFLLAAGERLEVLIQTTGGARGLIEGVELHERSARQAEQ